MRGVLAGLVSAAALIVPVAAQAADVQACIAASERAQRARAAGKLREARDSFQVCGMDNCPALVRKDCAEWQSEVNQSLPSVVFGAKDATGRDLFDVIVSMDGETIVTKLDGKSIPVDPGPHTFKFEVVGLSPVVEKALVKEGEKARMMTVSFDAGTAGTAAPQPQPVKPRGGGHTALPWVVVGLGGATVIAGLAVLLTSPALPESCSASTRTCAKLPGETPDQFAERLDRAGKHDAQPVTGGIVMGIGGALVVGGLVWHFLEPSAETTKAGVRVAPWVSASTAGLGLDARF